jgi:hypothetical protein
LAASLAKAVECVVLARTWAGQGELYLKSLYCKRKYGAANCSYTGDGLCSGAGSRELIYTVGVSFVDVWIMSGHVDKIQVVEHRVNARRKLVQSSSGLWALSQSVPRIISWVPTEVT